MMNVIGNLLSIVLLAAIVISLLRILLIKGKLKLKGDKKEYVMKYSDIIIETAKKIFVSRDDYKLLVIVIIASIVLMGFISKVFS